MNGLAQSPTAKDPTLRALVERGLAQAQAREVATATLDPPPATPIPVAARAAPPRALGPASDRACVETNLARKGLWRSAWSAASGVASRIRWKSETGVGSFKT